MQPSDYDSDGLPRSSGPAGSRGPTGSPGRYYAIGGALLVVAALALTFLSGSTAVFVGIAAAVSGAVLLIMGVQAGHDAPNLEQHYFDSQPEVDWDDNFKREFGGDGR